MIELYCIKNIEEPWKQKLINEYDSPEEMMAKMKFTRDEVRVLLEQAANDKPDILVRGKYFIEFAPYFMENLAVSVVCDGKGLTEEEIAAITGICRTDVNKAKNKALKKLRCPAVKKILCAGAQRKGMRMMEESISIRIYN